ncbi:MAG: putative amidohydrolase YtcJ [Halieaceae bacterium]|jgi:predicted amidohydrolase YtcJ
MRITAAILLFTISTISTASWGSTLIHNVRGHTMNDGQRIDFVALEYADGRVARIYRDDSELASSTAQVRVDGGGASLLPGLIDVHGHVAGLGLALASVDLVGTTSEAHAIARVAGRLQSEAGSDARSGWLLGRGWNQVLWPGGQFPSRQTLDRLSKDRPVALGRIDGHALWVNSRALALAGIDAQTADPAGGQIVRDSRGTPTGVLIDNAMGLVAAVMPASTLRSKREALARAMDYLVSLGMTSAHDAGVSAVELAAYDGLLADGDFPLRIYAMLDVLDAANDAALAAGPRIDEQGLLAVQSVKISADGALGSRGAALYADYSDDPGNSGLLLLSDEELNHHMQRAAAAGFQVNVHAIGDLANGKVLDEFTRLNEDPKVRSLRHRIEHAQILRPQDIERFAALDVIASVQPTHATSDKNMAGDRLGEARLEGAYAWRSLLESGARMAGGSDFPVEPADPFFGLHAAITRQDREGVPPGGWRAEEALSREQAMALFTEDAAYAAHAEKRIGRLLPGYAADFILVRDDIFTVDAAKLWENQVLATVVAGKVVYADAQSPLTK